MEIRRFGKMCQLRSQIFTAVAMTTTIIFSGTSSAFEVPNRQDVANKMANTILPFQELLSSSSVNSSNLISLLEGLEWIIPRLIALKRNVSQAVQLLEDPEGEDSEEDEEEDEELPTVLDTLNTERISFETMVKVIQILPEDSQIEAYQHLGHIVAENLETEDQIEILKMVCLMKSHQFMYGQEDIYEDVIANYTIYQNIFQLAFLQERFNLEVEIKSVDYTFHFDRAAVQFKISNQLNLPLSHWVFIPVEDDSCHFLLRSEADFFVGAELSFSHDDDDDDLESSKGSFVLGVDSIDDGHQDIKFHWKIHLRRQNHSENLYLALENRKNRLAIEWRIDGNVRLKKLDFNFKQLWFIG